MSDSSKKQRGYSPFSKLAILVNTQFHKTIRKNLSRRGLSSRVEMTELSLLCRRWQCFPDMAVLEAFNPSQEANALACQFLQRCCATLFNAETSGHPWQSPDESVQLCNAVCSLSGHQAVNILGCFTILPIGAWNRGTGSLEKQKQKTLTLTIDGIAAA